MVAAAIAAGAAALGAAASIYSTASADRSGPARQQQIANQQLDDDRRNQLYQQMVSALTNQRAVAGTRDSFGSTSEYDPGSNTWISKLGDLPQQADTASMQAGIRQNTTQARMAELANEQAAVRAARAGPAADAAQRELSNFRPMTQDALIGLLTNQATTAANETFRPIEQDTLRQYARTGENAGPVMANLGRTQNDQLRKSLQDAMITGMTGTDQLNASRRSGLENAATTATAFSNPQFQATAVAPSANAKNLTDLLAARSQSSVYGPSYGAAGVNTANKNASDAYGRAFTAAGALGSQPGAEIGKQLSDLGRDKYVQDAIKGFFSSGSSTGPGSVDMTSFGTNPAEMKYYNDYQSNLRSQGF